MEQTTVAVGEENDFELDIAGPERLRLDKLELAGPVYVGLQPFDLEGEGPWHAVGTLRPNDRPGTRNITAYFAKLTDLLPSNSSNTVEVTVVQE